MPNLYKCGVGAPKLQSKTVSPSTSAQTIKPDSNYDGLSQVTVNAIKYDENNPRVEGTAKSYSGNIVWVGSIDNYLLLKLKDTDKKIKLITSGSALNNYKIYIDGVQVDTFNVTKDSPVTKTYALSKNDQFQVTVGYPLQGDITVQWDYKIW